jgi:hypothetical protein
MWKWQGPKWDSDIGWEFRQCDRTVHNGHTGTGKGDVGLHPILDYTVYGHGAVLVAASEGREEKKRGSSV